MIGHIHSIETFGTVDGPGTRFVVFFKGCPMRCAYCHNPDTWELGGGEEWTADKRDISGWWKAGKPDGYIIRRLCQRI